MSSVQERSGRRRMTTPFSYHLVSTFSLIFPPISHSPSLTCTVPNLTHTISHPRIFDGCHSPSHHELCHRSRGSTSCPGRATYRCLSPLFLITVEVLTKSFSHQPCYFPGCYTSFRIQAGRQPRIHQGNNPPDSASQPRK
jgi:hypothetical protein